MRALLAALSLSLLAMSRLFAGKRRRNPSAAQKKQQERMKSCNERAGVQKLEGDKRKEFMSSCLKGEQKALGQPGPHGRVQRGSRRQGPEGRRAQEFHERMPEGLKFSP